MEILKYSLGQLQTNCYFVVEDNDCLIIDPADEAGFILEEIRHKKLNLVGLLATHGHFDHVMAVGEIQRSIDVPLYLSKKDLFLVERMAKTAEYFLGHRPSILPIKKIENLNIKNLLEIDNWKLEIIPCPGHTPGGLSFYLPEEKILFTGDTLFKQGIGRYDFSYSNKKDLFNSVKNILKLPKETIINPGHGEQATIANEQNVLATLY